MKIISKMIVISALIIPIKIKAYCSNDELARYKILASSIETYYTFDDDSKKMDLTIYNITDDLLAQIEKEDHYPNNNEIKIYNLNPGQTIKMFIYPKESCEEYPLRTIYVNLPHYNKYYNDEICKNNNHTLCSKWVNTSIYTHEQFIEKIKTGTQKEETEKEPEKVNNERYGFLDFLGDFYIPILLFIIITGSIWIYRLKKKDRFDF